LLAKGSKEEAYFIENIIQIIKNLNMSSIQNAKALKEIVQFLLFKVEKS